MIQLSQALIRWWRREDGTATVEFALMLPLITSLFVMSFEAGMLQLRQSMLERSLEMAMEDLRLGNVSNPTHNKLRDTICDHLVVVSNCKSVLKIDLQVVNTTTWVLPSSAPTCIDRSKPIAPVINFETGGGDEMMLVRVCLPADPLFPSTGIGLGLPKDGAGAYHLISQSAFVNEPS